MAGERLSMRKIKEVLRLKFENHLSVRQIAESCGIGKSTVAGTKIVTFIPMPTHEPALI